MLSPENFKKAVKYYEEASSDYEDKDESLVDIKEKLQKSKFHALEALKVITLAKDNLLNSITAREEALEENAPLLAPEDWEEAEKVFMKATTNLEDDDLKDAIKFGARSYDMFKRTRILAIKNGILSDARNQINLALQEESERYCLSTIRTAQNLLSEAEAILAKDPFAKDQSNQKAMEAAYQGRHALYLARTIKQLSKKEENWELMILQFEGVLSRLGTQFHFQPEFDEGFNSSVEILSGYIHNLKEEEKRLLAENGNLEEKLSILKESEANKSAELLKKEQLENRIEKIRNLFTKDEAIVIYQGKNLIIRLIGLQFPSGRSIIQPEFFSLLTKMQRAIREFPDKYILVEGHTDATGNSIKNKTLSEQRARAVTEYLIANLELNPEQIEYYGMGEQKPIASNKTAKGRTKNRRIDIIISIEDS